MLDNALHTHRHAYCAYEDFSRLRQLLERFVYTDPEEEELWHSLSHHLRHVVWRTSQEVPANKRRYVRRASS